MEGAPLYIGSTTRNREYNEEDRAGSAPGEEEARREGRTVSGCPEVASSALVSWGTRVEVRTLVHHLRIGYTPDDYLEGFPSVSRERAEGYLDVTPEAARQEVVRRIAAGGPRTGVRRGRSDTLVFT
ncbi:MAG: DUF433 domain-containing protein [Actinomycetota bacterium]|nr:DUF433 domain-containing protein [Actinomycetota bacterium]